MSIWVQVMMSKKSVIIYFNYYLSNERSYYLSMLSHLMNLISILIRCMYWKLFSIYEQAFRWTRQSTLWKSNRISFVCASILHNRPFILKYSIKMKMTFSERMIVLIITIIVALWIVSIPYRIKCATMQISEMPWYCLYLLQSK